MSKELKDLIKEIKSVNDLMTVLNYYSVNYDTKKGACCPFHNEKTPSFKIKEENGEAMYKCFGCGAAGDVINFIKNKENMTTLEAVKKAYSILGKQCDIKPNKLDKLKDYIEKDNFYKLEGYYIEDIYIYMLDQETPSFLKVKYRSHIDKSKKDLRTYKVIDQGDYFKTVTKATGGEYNHTIYNYPRVKNAIENNYNIYFVEGEKDAETLNKLGLAATTIYSKKWNDKYTEQLRGAKIVFIGDTGRAGSQFQKLVWDNLKDVVKSFKVVTLPGLKQLGDNKDVTDWLETGKTKNDLIKAIKDAWDWKISTKWKDVKVTEKKDGTITVKPKKTIDNFKLILKETNTELFFNEISKQVEVKTKTFKNANLNTLAVELTSYAAKQEFSCTLQDVNNWLMTIAYENSVNPFREFLDGLEGTWDGTSRLKNFYNFFNTVEFFNDDLKEIILRRWLLQFVDSAYNQNFKSQGILVLKGRQGIYKTTSMEYLIPIKDHWVFLSEQKFEDTRDCKQTITSNQLVELSEFARSNKQVDALKGFVTAGTDKMVLKYDKHPVEYKRKTVYYATVNDAEFLLDDENRRFWILDLINIDIEGIKKFDFKQLWAELYHIYHVENDKRHWLDPSEISLLEESNQNYKFKGELEGQLEIHFNFSSSKRVWMTSAEVMTFIDGKYSTSKISRALKGMRIEQKAFNNKYMPRNKYNAMPLPRIWGGAIHSSYKNRLVNFELVDCASPFDSDGSVSSQEVSLKKELASKDILIMNKDKELSDKDSEIKKLQNQIMELMNKVTSSNKIDSVYKEELEKVKTENEELKQLANYFESKYEIAENKNTDLKDRIKYLESRNLYLENELSKNMIMYKSV